MLALEPLETRQLLAADLLAAGNLEHLTSNDPFSSDAYPLDQMIARTQTHSTVPGELTVAWKYDVGVSGRGSFDQSYWQSTLPTIPVDSSEVVIDYVRPDGSNVILVDISFDPSIDPTIIMQQLSDQPHVLWSSPTFSYEGPDPRELTPDDPSYGSQYHHPLMQNDDAWDITLGDASVIIAVTDDGVQLDHPDLSDNIWSNSDEIAGDGIDNDGNGYIDDDRGWDFSTSDNNPNPTGTASHGTHVAGIAAARTNNSTGVAGTAGHATIMPLKFYDSSVTWTAQAVRDSYVYAADNGAQIVTTSYNLDRWVGDANVDAGLQYIHDSGSLHFNSAGNGSTANPARQVFEQTLLVANTDSNDVKSGSSNWGTGIDLAAPGSSILSTVPGNAYDTKSGTSMAAPNAAGVAALIWSANPTWNSYQVAAQLLATADNIDAVNPSYVGLLGAGRVNSYRALTDSIAAPTINQVVGFPADGSVLTEALTSFNVDYSGIVDFDAANDPLNYQLSNAGPDGVFDTADDEVYPVSATSTYMLGGGDVSFELSGGQIESGLHRFRVINMVDPFYTPIDGDNDGIAGGDFETYFTVENPFRSVNSLPSLISTPISDTAELRTVDDVDAVSFFAEAGETVSAVITPVNSAATMTVQLVGHGAVISASAPGESVVLPLTQLTSDDDYTIAISGDTVTTYEYHVVRNANAEAFVESAAAVDITSSEISWGGSRYAALGQSGPSTTIDVDEFTLDLNDAVGETIDVQLSILEGPVSGSTLEVYDPLNNLVATGSTGFDSSLLSIQSLTIATAGTYTFRTSAVNGRYALVVTRDLALEVEPNDAPSANTRDITGLAGAFGALSADVAWELANDPTGFIDISGTGVALGLSDDGEASINLPFSNAILPSGTYTIANNGVIAQGNVGVDYRNTTIPSSDFSGVMLATFWDDISDDSGDVYYEFTTINGIDALIVQWHDRPHYNSSGTVTFQAQILDSDATPVRYAYQDIDFSDTTYNNGASATIGIQFDPQSADQFSYNTTAVSDGDVLTLRAQDNDVYAVQLSANESVTYRTETPFDHVDNRPQNNADIDLQLLDSSGNLVASDANSAPDGRNALLSYTATTAGTYYLNVLVPNGGSGQYTLLANVDTIDGDFTDDGVYDCEDIDALVAQIASGTFSSDFDLTLDGVLNLADVEAWLVEAGAAELPDGGPFQFGDANLDGTVDVSDYAIFNQHRFSNTASWCAGDFNADGAVDITDFSIWNQNRFRPRPLAITAHDTRHEANRPLEINVDGPADLLNVDLETVPCHQPLIVSTAYRPTQRTTTADAQVFAELDASRNGLRALRPLNLEWVGE